MLSAAALALFEDADSALYVSIASLWECAIKCSVGKLRLPASFYQSVARDYRILSVRLNHIEAYASLPMHHRDPFDRLLVVQAQLGGLTLVTRDQNIANYDVSILIA